MKEGLADLLVRKTEEGHRNARAAVENWRKAVETAERAAKQAEYELTLPPVLTEPVSRLAQEISTANYVAAVGIAARAVSARHDMIRIATEGLERELRIRGEDAKAAHRELETLKSAYEQEKREANSQKTKAQSPNAFYTPPVLPEAPRTGDSIKAGCALGCLSYIVLLLLAGLAWVVGSTVLDSPFGTIIVLPLMMLMLGGWLIAPIWESASHGKKCRRLEAEARSKAKEEASASLLQAERMLAEAEKEYKTHLPTCERAVEQADQRVQKAESALTWLRAQG